MFKKLFIASVFLGCFSLSSVAQDVEGVNARLDAMGGAGVPSDYGFVINRPLKCVAWADRVQATGIMKEITGLETRFGSVIATKSIFKDRFAIGLTFNDRTEMQGDFYGKYADAPYYANVIYFEKENVMLEKFPNYPRLLMGFKVNDNFTFGLGSIIEHSTYDLLIEREEKHALTTGIPPDTLSMVVDSMVDYKYFGIGGLLDFKIKFPNSIAINPEFKVFVPKFEGTTSSDAMNKINDNPNLAVLDTFTNTDWALKSTDIKDNIVIKAGSKIMATINDVFVIAGLWYETKRFNYERKLTQNSAILGPGVDTTIGSSGTINGGENIFKRDQILFWGGFEHTIFDGLYFTPDYVGKWTRSTVTHPSAQDTSVKNNGDTTITVREHKFRLGVEKECKGFWVIKNFVPRMGLTYTHIRVSKDILNSRLNGLNTNEIQNSPVSTNFKLLGDQDPGLKLSMGFGLEGKYATLDLSADVLKWKNGLILGPQAALVTMTVFGSGRKSGPLKK
jgi:hypothetical protein